MHVELNVQINVLFSYPTPLQCQPFFSFLPPFIFLSVLNLSPQYFLIVLIILYKVHYYVSN